MDNIYIDYFAFFVPNRLTWIHWKEFMGENNASAGIPVSTYSIPYCDHSTAIESGSYGDYFGLPIGISNVLKQNKVSALPFRGLALIYNRWFRNQNVIAPLPVDTSDTNQVLVGSSSFIVTSAARVLKAAKLPDYFTSALPYAQKGAAVSIPLGTTAPILWNSSTSTNVLKDVSDQPVLGSSTPASVDYANGHLVFNGSQVNLDNSGKLLADLSQATAATINQLRYAFQLQKALEKDCNGSRYWEILSNHFGIRAPDATLQDPEYLGGFRQRVNIDQVLTTAGYDDTSAQEVGKPGANSVTASKSSLFTKSFVEHGYIFIVAVARHDQTYSQGVNRMWTRSSRFDFYLPVFANLGAQDIKLREIYAQGTSADDGVFGYQEAWAEYRYKPSIASGLLRPQATGSLDFWTLTNNFAAAPTLGQTFMEQDRSNLQRALTTGSSGPDFIADFYFRDIAVRPMPMYSIPGLIDHH